VSTARDTGGVGTVGISTSIDLPFFDRNQGRIAEERATRKQLFDEYAARVASARSDVATIMSSIHFLRRQIAAVEGAVRSRREVVDRYHQAFELATGRTWSPSTSAMDGPND